jgi:hypothetical protein
MSQAYTVHDEDDEIYGIGEREQLVAFNPRATPESSPEPAEKPVSPSASNSDKNAKKRRKVLPSKGDAYLLRTSHPNYPEVSRIAEHHLPSAESDDDSMEDVADMDERLAKSMAEEDQKKYQLEEERLQNRKQPDKTPAATEEEEMVDVSDMDEQLANEMESNSRDQEDVAEDVQQIAADALIATDALKKIEISSPAQQPTPSDQMDHDHRASDASSFQLPSRKHSDGLGIWIKPEAPTPLPMLPMTPMEPTFSNYDPFPALSPLYQRHNSVTSPGGKIPEMLQSPASPEAATSPQTQLPSAREILEVADKMNEAHRQRHASMSSMASPSALPNGAYRASFSGAHPSPSMVSERTSPKSSLALSPPSGLLRRESYPLLSSATTNDSLSSTDVTSPSNTLPTPQSETHRQSMDERTLPPIPGVPRTSISIPTIPAIGSGGYKCDFPGCTALPFQTSYLLKYVPCFATAKARLADTTQLPCQCTLNESSTLLSCIWLPTR